MRKLTKIINKRRKNYKPTVGVIDENGKRKSVNGTLFYIRLEKIRDFEARREAQALVEQFLRQEIPGFFKLFDALDASRFMMY